MNCVTTNSAAMPTVTSRTAWTRRKRKVEKKEGKKVEKKEGKKAGRKAGKKDYMMPPSLTQKL